MPPAAGTLQQPLLDGSDNDKAAPPHVAIGVGGERAPQPQAVAEGVVPIVLETRGLNYYLGGENGHEKQILKGVNLKFSSGVLTAVMGYVSAGSVCVSLCMSICWRLPPTRRLRWSIDGRADIPTIRPTRQPQWRRQNDTAQPLDRQRGRADRGRRGGQRPPLERSGITVQEAQHDGPPGACGC